MEIIMTKEQRDILQRINAYAENTLGEIDPQKVLVSKQLDTLKPIMETISKEMGISIEEVFILYMDLQSEASVAMESKLQEELKDINSDGDMPLLFR